VKKGKFDRYAPKFEKEEAVAAAILGHVVTGTLAHDRVGTKTVIKNTIQSGLRTVLDDDKPKTPSYKARPLNGIWATAPYLHNGSVPTLWQLLRPKDRRKTFHVGNREFDHKEVGFKYDESDYGPNDPKFRFNTKLKGNLNTGHTYGKKFFQDPTKDPDEKLTKGEKRTWALIEYLKKL